MMNHQVGALARDIDAKLLWVREAAGARFDDLELQVYARYACLTPDVRAAAERLTDTFRAPVGDVLDAPNVLIGDAAQIVERIHERRERWGYSYFSVDQPVARDFAKVVARIAA